MLRTVKQEEHPTKNYSIPFYKVSLVKEASVVMGEERFCSAGQLTRVLNKYYDGLDREHFVVVMLNSKNRILGFNTVSIGSLNQAIIHPREVFKPAVACSAAAVILSHNHPSGDPEPSGEDRAITDRLKFAGDILGIKILDHLIIGDGEKYFSFTENEQQKQAELNVFKENEWTKRRLDRIEKSVARGSATGEEIVFLAAHRIKNIYQGDSTIQDIITQLEEIILMLTPVSERKRGPVEVRKKALNWIEIANDLIVKMKQQQQEKTARSPLTCPPGCVPGMKLKMAA